MKPTLSLKPRPAEEHAHVREAKKAASDVGYPGDPHMIAFALALVESRDEWENRPKR